MNDTSSRQISGKQAAEISIQNGFTVIGVVDSVDYAYEALCAHERSCAICSPDGPAKVKEMGECAVGESLAKAWGLAEGFRDFMRKAEVPR